MTVKANSIDTAKIYSNKIHHRVIKKFKQRKVMVNGIDQVYAADLAIMEPERGYRYILVVICIFSKFLWCVPLKKKTGTEVKEAFEKLFKELGRKPKKIFSDRGKEFYNKIFQIQVLEKR